MNIDDNIEIPPVGGSRGRRKYPFAQMEVGQSIYVEGIEEGKRANAAAHAWARDKKAMMYRTLDGRMIDKSNMPILERLKFVEENPGYDTIVGRKRFTGRQMGNGWRIWRAKDEPIPDNEWITIDGFKILKEDPDAE